MKDFVSLFCGAGGFDLGFAERGFVCRSAYDNNRLALETRAHNLSGPSIHWDLTLPLPALHPGLDVVIAGPPCQGFSTAGKRALDDPRNSLMIAAAEHIVRLRPRVAVIENVRGALSGKHIFYWKECNNLLRDQGYNSFTLECETADFGIAQHRKRMILFAWLGHPTSRAVLTRKSLTTVGEAIATVGIAPDHLPTELKEGSEYWSIASRIQQGQKLCDVRSSPNCVHSWQIPDVFGHTDASERDILRRVMRLRRQSRVRDFGDADPVSLARLHAECASDASLIVERLIEKGFLRRSGAMIDLARTFNGKFRRLRLDAAAPTVDTHFGEPRSFLHPREHRGLTQREAARIQSFPDRFVFKGSRSRQFSMIGNAVPPAFAAALAEMASGFLSDCCWGRR